MRRNRTLAAAAAVAVAGTMLLTLSPAQGSKAQWRDTATVAVIGSKSDTFDMTATNAPFPAPDWPSSGRVSNSPRVDVTNESARHSSWVNVHSTNVKKVVTPDTNTILTQMALDYEYGEQECRFPLGVYWQARIVGQITDNTTYPRTQNKVAFGTLAPGQKGSLCPAVRLNYTTSTEAGQRSALLNHAGRALDITTVVNQKSESPATWASDTRTAISRYRIALPTPQKPAAFNVCRNTNSSGNPDGVIQAYGGFFWGWPDAATSGDPTTTPAMAGGWDILRQNTTGSWEFFAAATTNNRRQRAGINSRNIYEPASPNTNIRKFKLRGYPFAGDKTRYVESSWIARAHHTSTTTTGNWACDAPEVNPEAGPHNMP